MTSLISKQGTPLYFVCNLLFCEEICLTLIKQVVSIPYYYPFCLSSKENPVRDARLPYFLALSVVQLHAEVVAFLWHARHARHNQ